MAGNHVYLEPILDQATGGLNEIVENINNNVTAQINKLEEVANILTNILSNTGISITQKAFNGADINRTVYTWTDDFKFAYDLTTGAETLRTQTGYIPNLVGNDIVYPNSSFATYRNVDNGVVIEKDLTDINNLHYETTVSSIAYTSVQLLIDGEVVKTTGNETVDYDLSGYTGTHTVKFNPFAANAQGSSYAVITIKNIKFDDEFMIKSGMAQITNNCIAKNSNVTDDRKFACAMEFATALTDVNLWSQLIVQGSGIENLKVYILNDRFQIYKEINRSTDLADLDLYSNFYVGFVADNSSLISNVIFRYS